MVEVVAVRSPFFSQGDQYWSCLARPGCSGPMGEGAVQSGHTSACIVASVNLQIEDGHLHSPSLCRIAARKLDEVDGSMPGYQLPSHASSAQCLAETVELLERGVRVSLTFRRVRREPRCACGHSTLCDWTKHTYTQ